MRFFFCIFYPLFFFLCSGFCFSNNIYAQRKKDASATVMGVITEESKDYIPTMYTNICLIQGSDTLKKVIGNNKFIFEKVNPGKIRISVSNIAFEPQENTYDVVGGNNMIYITLKEKKNELKEATVSAQTQIMREIKDTIIYNAAAVSTMEGENAIEIFRQLPGAVIENGKFLVFGEEIKRTYVNGVLIYGENPNESMNALLAKEVINMKVYDEDNLEDLKAGMKNARKEKVLNITTYSDIMAAIDAYAIAGYGTDIDKDIWNTNKSRYNGGLTAAYYSEMLKLKVEGQSNSIGRTSNLLNDIISTDTPMNSYKESTYALFEGEKYWKDRRLGNSLAVTYKYDKEYVSNASFSVTRYFPTEQTPQMSYIDSTINSNVRHNHYLHLYSDLQNTSLKHIVLYADGNISTASSNQYAYIKNNVGGQIYQQKGLRVSNGGNKDIKAGIWWRDHDGWGKILPSIRIKGNFSDNKFRQTQIDTTESSFTRRILESESVGKSISLSGTFNLSAIVTNTEKLTFKWDNGYEYCYDRHKDIRTTYDILDITQPVLNLTNTHDYTYNVQTHALSSMLAINTSRKTYIDFGIEVGVDIQSDREMFPSSGSFIKKFWFFNPTASLSHKGLKARYHIDTDIPSLEQLRNRLDDSNPLMLLAGNPDLKQSKTGYLDLTWGHRVGRNGLISFGAKFNHSWDAIVPRMTYFPEDTYLEAFDYTALKGSSLYSFTNVPGKLGGIMGISYRVRIKKIKGNFSTGLNYRFVRQPQYVGDQLEVMYQNKPELTFDLTSSPAKWVKVNISVDIGYTSSKNSQGQFMIGQFTQSASARINANFLKNAFLNASYRLENFTYLHSTETDQNFHLLNSAMGYKFMKGRLTMSFSATDILKAKSSYNMTATSNFVKENWTPYTGRYVMFNIYYRFNKTSPNKY